MDTHTETKQRAEYQEVMVICQESLKEGLGTIALHVRCIYVRSLSCGGEGGFHSQGSLISVMCVCGDFPSIFTWEVFTTSAGS